MASPSLRPAKESTSLNEQGPVANVAERPLTHCKGDQMEPVDKRSDSRSTFAPATPAQLFAAMSDPSRVARWWGPDGFTSTMHQFDFRPGGAWLLTMHGPDGTDYPNESRFSRLVPGELFEIEHLSGHHFMLSIKLKAVAGGTQIHWRQTFDTIEHFESIAQFVSEANAQNLKRLAAEALHPAGAS